MAERTAKWHDNAPGEFYVDNQCLGCDACRVVAPKNFDRNNEEDHSYVKRQPRNKRELKQCLQAIEDCPHYAIGDDGALS